MAAAHATAAFTLEVGLAALLLRAAFIFLLLLALAVLLALAPLLLLALGALLALAALLLLAVLAALLLLLTVLTALLLLLTVAPATLVLLALPVAVLIVAFLHVKSPLKVPDLTRWKNVPPERRVPLRGTAALVPVAKRYRAALNRFAKVGNNRDCG